jgi:hypothetical protein
MGWNTHRRELHRAIPADADGCDAESRRPRRAIALRLSILSDPAAGLC